MIVWSADYRSEIMVREGKTTIFTWKCSYIFISLDHLNSQKYVISHSNGENPTA